MPTFEVISEHGSIPLHLIPKLGATHGFTFLPSPKEKVDVEREVIFMPGCEVVAAVMSQQRSQQKEPLEGLQSPHIHINRIKVDASLFHQQPALCDALRSSPQIGSISDRLGYIATLLTSRRHGA